MSSLRLVVPTLLALLVASACGGGGGGGGDPEPALFEVRSMAPASGAIGVSNDATIDLVLTRPVMDSTVGPDSIVVRARASGAASTGRYAVSPDGMIVSFTPEPWYETSTAYAVEVNPGLVSKDGEPLAGKFAGTFSTSSWPSPRAVTQAEFLSVPGRMSTGRSHHTATLLPDETVLLAGGFRTGSAVTETAEVYVPSQGVFSRVQPMKQARAGHTASLLPSDEGVIIAGGEKADGTELSSCELYSWQTGEFTPAAPMSVARTVHTATTLPDGRVLVTGGYPEDIVGRTAEIFDPVTGTWSPTANDMSEARWGHAATLITEGPLAGRVLITGGYWSSMNPLRTVEIFDPATDRFRPAKGQLNESRWRHSAVELTGGTVLLSDGGSPTGELFDPSTESFVPTSNAEYVTRYGALAFRFRSDEVLIAGGFDYRPDGTLFLHQTVKQYVRNYGSTGRYFSRQHAIDGGVTLFDRRAYAAGTRLADGGLLISGGLGPDYDGPNLDTATIFDPRP